jgi:hypothetical protein
MSRRRETVSSEPRKLAAESVLDRSRYWCIFRGMDEATRLRMLEVSVTPDRPPRWEWQVTSNGEVIANGFENGQIEARFEGYNAMFQLLAARWP